MYVCFPFKLPSTLRSPTAQWMILTNLGGWAPFVLKHVNWPASLKNGSGAEAPADLSKQPQVDATEMSRRSCRGFPR